MQALWPKGIHYKLLRTISNGDFRDVAEVWGELIALDPQDHPLASELVVYKVESGLVWEICVYKQMHPSHPAYQS
jgi:DNA-binding SARP family transcriptional activator